MTRNILNKINEKKIDRIIISSSDLISNLTSLTPEIRKVVDKIATCLNNGKKIILFGKKSVDNDHHQTGILVSELLEIEAVSCCTEYTVEENMIKIKREIEGIQEIYESKLPIIITQEKGKNEVRYPSLKDLMAAKKKPIENRKVEVEKDRITTSNLESLIWIVLSAISP